MKPSTAIPLGILLISLGLILSGIAIFTIPSTNINGTILYYIGVIIVFSGIPLFLFGNIEDVSDHMTETIRWYYDSPDSPHNKQTSGFPEEIL